VATSQNRPKRYNCELVDAYEARYGTTNPGVGLKGEQDTLR
jgi:transcription initiation factor TFIIB